MLGKGNAPFTKGLQGRLYSLKQGLEIERITSPANDRVKALRALERKKERQESGLFLAEGPRLVRQGLACGWQLETLAVAQTALERGDIAGLVGEAAQSGASVFAGSDKVMERLARKDNPNAVVGAFHQKRAEIGMFSALKAPIWLALHTVRDPGNLGTILRTADCAGLSGLILIGQCCDPFSIETVRASMGSIFDVAIAETDIEGFQAWRRAQGLSVVAASMNGTYRHDEVDFSQPHVILMGNEQAGLPADVEDSCDSLARIPMRGGADSLNLAQATAIFTYEAWRQRGFA